MKNNTDTPLKNWYLLLITGMIFTALGVWTIAAPLRSFMALAWLFSIGFIVTGLTEVIYSVSNRKRLRNWGWFLAAGILTFIIGLQLSFRPGLTALMLCLYIGFWLMFRAIMNISTSIELKSAGTKNWGWVLVLGILGVLFSFVLLWNPTLTGMTISLWMGFGLLALGALQILLAFGLRKIKKKVTEFRKELEGEYAEIIEED